MPERLTLHYDWHTAAWLDPDGGLVRGTLAEAAEAAAGREAVLLLPGEDVLIARVQLPPIRQAARRAQAARYALEDQLVSRVENLHFALAAKADTEGYTAVAVIDRERLRQLIDDCIDAGLDVGYIAPDALALPTPAAGDWQVAMFSHRVVTRLTADRGFACEPALWPTLAEASAPAPERLRIHAPDDTATAPSEPAFERPPEMLHETAAGDDALYALMLSPRSAAALPALNLRSGDFARVSAQAWWHPFKLAAGLAAAWLVLAIAGRAIETWQLDQRIDALHQQSLAAFHDAFPNVQTINDLRVQAEEGIRALRGTGGAGGVFPLLQATASVLGPSESLSLQSLQYRNGELDMSLSGKNVQAVEALRAGFARQNHTALTVQSADASSAGVQIQATLENTRDNT